MPHRCDDGLSDDADLQRDLADGGRRHLRHLLPLCCLHALEVETYPTNSSPDLSSINLITIMKTTIARGSSLDRDLEGFPLNHVEVDQRGHDDCVVVDDGDAVDEGDVVEEGGLHDA